MIAGALLAFIPELGTLTRGGVAAIVGVAPYARDSGRMRGRRVCPDKGRGGRKDIRDLPLMAAVTVATRKGNRFAILYQRLLDAGKPRKGGPDCRDAKNRYNTECNRREIKLCMPPKHYCSRGFGGSRPQYV